MNTPKKPRTQNKMSPFHKLLQWFMELECSSTPLDSHEWYNRQEIYRQIQSPGSHHDST